jgi:hypothetical protein
MHRSYSPSFLSISIVNTHHMVLTRSQLAGHFEMVQFLFRCYRIESLDLIN